MRHDECNREGSFCNSDEGPFIQSNRASPLLLVVTSGDERFLTSKEFAAAAWGQVNTFARVQMYSFATLHREEEEGPDP